MKKPLCAATHVKHDSFFLDFWVRHYGALVGRENLYVFLDGDDWDSPVDLEGVNVERLIGSPDGRIRHDRWIAEVMSKAAHKLRKRYDFVIRTDVDEFMITDPDAGADMEDLLRQQGDRGYVYALGVDMVHDPETEGAYDPARPVFAQRRQGFISDKYSKPFVIWRWNNWTGGAHRLINRDVVMDPRFLMVHLALFDRDTAIARMSERAGGEELHKSHQEHQNLRLAAIERAADAPLMDFAAAREIALKDFTLGKDGGVAKRPRASNHDNWREDGFRVQMPERFAASL